MPDIRIPTKSLKPTQDVVFGRRSWRGPDLATRLRVKHITLWAWLNRNGLPVKMAEPLAQELERRGEELSQAAASLRDEADKALVEAAG